MVKPKQRRIHSGPGGKKRIKVDLPDEGEWVMVKKQRITILIPALADKVQSTMLQEKPRDTKSQLPCESEKSKSLYAIREKASSLYHGVMMFGDSADQRMRALYVERKVNKAGGLENWLVSLGLARFVKVFESRRMNKFQLANLTMKKLKDMGADAVGPRRKLMHAIDCICEPHCFHSV